MKKVTKVVYKGPFCINSTHSLYGSKSQIVSNAVFFDNRDIMSIRNQDIVMEKMAAGGDRKSEND